ncbi:hypothetical protein RMB03_20780 [Acinetobacter sp. V91_7]|uniref:hypothetical protein n=1 Tax=unclassified Acinetobacter TaxID=196816 RepID=UPI00287F33D7|nr:MULTISPECIES: hypothetical protein [unclassified Acinetobacter]MDS7933594.1 hypothetical protein [Acinetobacter sp. V91_4B]MDS7965384.1 hypothetical protein [Acinetobacter sp. V91_7]MDS8029213.1 hypothetical protein [Acinetobacter sp. V91_13]
MNICIQIEDYISPFASQLPKVETEDLIYVEKYESDSYDHWMFGSDSNSLIGKVNSHTLTVQNGATVQPSYGDNYVDLSVKGGNALISQLLDSSVTGFTLSGLVKPRTSELSTLMGVLGASSTSDGFGLFTVGEKLYATIRPQVSSWDVGIVLDPAMPVFTSISINKTAGTAVFCAYQDGMFYSKETGNLSYVNSNLPLSIGNNRYASSVNSTTQHFESIIHTKALTVSQIQALAQRMKVRQEHRGVIF